MNDAMNRPKPSRADSNTRRDGQANRSDTGRALSSRRRRSRRMVLVGLVVLMVLLAVPMILMRTPILKMIVVPRLSRMFDAQVSISKLVINADATIVAKDIRLRVRGLDDGPGEADEVLTIDRLDMQSSWSEILSGAPLGRMIVLNHPVLRVSMDTKDGSLNLGRLHIPVDEHASASATIPKIIVRDGRIELGEHSSEGYTPLRTLTIEGSVLPTPDPDHLGYNIAFSQGAIHDSFSPGEKGLELAGRISADGITLMLEGLDFGDWKPEHIPAQYRQVFELMHITGSIPHSTLHLSPQGAALVRVVLDGVSLTLPFDATGHQASGDDLVRLRQVTGTVEVSEAGARAVLKGTFGDLPTEVDLTYRGLDADAPFTCLINTKGFELSSKPEILSLAPAVVLDRLADFSNPTATVDAAITIERAAPVADEGQTRKPGPISVQGQLAFRDGSAAFRAFPYRFYDLKGVAQFDESGIEILSVTGKSESGATLAAHGTIAPPTPDAKVDLRITVDDVPFDDALLEAIGPKRATIVKTLLSKSKYEALVKAGLIAADSTQGGDGSGFAFAGKANVEIVVTRAQGVDQSFDHLVTVSLPQVGLVPEPFPLPIVARDVVIRVDPDRATLTHGTFAGLTGGSLDVDLNVDLHKPGERGIDLVITGRALPADDLLLAAIPGGLTIEPADEQPTEEDDRADREAAAALRTPSSMLAQLHMHGTLDTRVHVLPRDSGVLGYDIEVDLDSLSAAPNHLAHSRAKPILLDGLTGVVRVSETLVSIDASATLKPQRITTDQTDDTTQAKPKSDSSGQMHVRSTIGLGNPHASPIHAELTGRVDDVGLAVEDLLGIVAPAMAEKIITLRERHAPSGGVSTRLRIAGDLARADRMALFDRVDIELFGCRNLEFNTPTCRVTLTSDSGSINLSALDPTRVLFDDFSATLTQNDTTASEVTLAGVLPVGEAASWSADDSLEVRVSDARLDSPIVVDALATILPARLSASLADIHLRGQVDARLTIAGQNKRVSGANQKAEDARPPLVTGTITPAWLEMTLGEKPMRIASMKGGIVLDETGGSFDQLRVDADGWWASLTGSWVGTGDGSVLLEGTLNGQSQVGLRQDIRSLLPTSLQQTLDALALDTDTMLQAHDVSLRMSIGDEAGTAFRSSGRIGFSGMRAKIGVTVEKADGYCDFTAETVPGAELANFGVGIVFDRITAAGVRLHNGAMRITSDPLSNLVLVPIFVADAYTGRLTGSAVVTLPDSDADETNPAHTNAPSNTPSSATYEARLALSDVPLGELLADWEHAAGIERAGENARAVPVRKNAQSRGMVDAQLSLAGTVGQDHRDRRGRGRIQVGGGPVLRLPLLLPLIQVSNLQLPAGTPIDYGEAVFYLDGDRVVFERMGVFAGSVEIFGYGQMVLPSMNLDLRITSRAINRLPILNAIVEKFRNELITTKVTGTPAKPEISILQFAHTRQLLANALGQDLSDEERRMLEIERLSREAIARERKALKAMRAPPG